MRKVYKLILSIQNFIATDRVEENQPIIWGLMLMLYVKWQEKCYVLYIFKGKTIHLLFCNLRHNLIAYANK